VQAKHPTDPCLAILVQRKQAVPINPLVESQTVHPIAVHCRQLLEHGTQVATFNLNADRQDVHTIEEEQALQPGGH
jgi:hypothetical protein